MEKFYKYRTKTKHLKSKGCMCAQKNVFTKDVILKFRLTSEMKNEITELAVEKGKSASELTRLLWEDYLSKKRNIEWKKETAEWE